MTRKLLAFVIALALAAPVSAEVVYRRRGASSTIQFANVLASTGVITTGATFTLTCGCIAEAGTLALAACNAGTTAAEIGTTGVFNLTVNSADIANDFCFIKAVAGTIAGSVDHLFEVRTRENMSAFDVTNPSGTAVTFASTGSNGAGLTVSANGTGVGMSVTGGSPASGDGSNAVNFTGGAAGTSGVGGIGWNVTGGAAIGTNKAGGGAAVLTAGAPTGTANATSVFVTASGSGGGGRGLYLAGGGAYPGLQSQGGSTGIGVTLIGGGVSGAALNASSTTGDAMTVTSAAGNGDAIQLTPHGTGVGINGTVATVNSIATNGITAASLAADSITSSEIAASAAQEIATTSGQRVE